MRSFGKLALKIITNHRIRPTLRETIIHIDTANPVELFGVNNANIDLIRRYFPKLKIIARGDTLNVVGDDEEMKEFERKFNLLVKHYNRFNQLTENNIIRLLEPNGEEVMEAAEESDDILVFGPNGLMVKARTANQRKIVEASRRNDMVFALGPAGTGKTYMAVALAVNALKNKEVRKIILTRPAVEAGENLGFLPGDLQEKLDPYLQPLYDALHDMIPPEKLNYYFETGVIQIAPLAFMRGRTLDKAFVILDEAQNATNAQLKMFLTRMGQHARFIITGDASQIDLPRNQQSGLFHARKALENIKGIAFVDLDEQDVVRHKLVKAIIAAYEKNEPVKKSGKE